MTKSIGTFSWYLKMRGFGPTWCKWIKCILLNRTFSVKLNNFTGAYFQSHKGVRQGDPLSPFLFNMAAECLCKMVLNAPKNKLIVGLATDLIENGVAILQYADDTVKKLCIDHDTDRALNLKLLLYMFEMMYGLKIKFQKVESFVWEEMMRSLKHMLISLTVKLGTSL